MIGVSPEVRDDLADLRDERGDQNLNQTVERLLYGEDNA
jgi:hypothetical protein